jgi:hypothetical protein
MIIDLSDCIVHKPSCGSKLYRFEDKIIKIPKLSYCGDIEEEFEMHKQLFNEGIRVAKPYDLVELLNTVNDVRLRQKSIGLLMQFIPGPLIQDLPYELRVKAAKEYEKELKKCEKLGFEIFDPGYHNGIYNPKNGVYLTDFERWGRK